MIPRAKWVMTGVTGRDRSALYVTLSVYIDRQVTG